MASGGGGSEKNIIDIIIITANATQAIIIYKHFFCFVFIIFMFRYDIVHINIKKSIVHKGNKVLY